MKMVRSGWKTIIVSILVLELVLSTGKFCKSTYKNAVIEPNTNTDIDILLSIRAFCTSTCRNTSVGPDADTKTPLETSTA